MFDNIGGKIKTLAQAVCCIGIITSVLVGIIMMASHEELALTGFIVMICGSLFSWVGSFMTYGFGQLIDNSDKIVRAQNNTQNTAYSGFIAKENSPLEVQKDDLSKDGGQIDTKVGTCEICDREAVLLRNCVIKDDMGTRYRNICENCMSKYNISKNSSLTGQTSTETKDIIEEKIPEGFWKCMGCGEILSVEVEKCKCGYKKRSEPKSLDKKRY